MFFNILFSFDSFQNIPQVPIIYLKYYYVNTLKTYNINTIFNIQNVKTQPLFTLAMALIHVTTTYYLHFESHQN
jgi:hypothetical protein